MICDICGITLNIDEYAVCEDCGSTFCNDCADMTTCAACERELCGECIKNHRG